MLSISERVLLSLRTRVRHVCEATAGYTRTLRQRRFYHITSIPRPDMTVSGTEEVDERDQIICEMPEERQKWFYQDTLKRLDLDPELDDLLAKDVREAMKGNISKIEDIHHQIESPEENIWTPVKNVGWKPEEAPSYIVWPSGYSDPVASVGGLIKNTVMASTPRELKRNLDFLDTFSDQIDGGEGKLSSVVQYYVGRGTLIPFETLNFLLGEIADKRLTQEELQDEKTVTETVHRYINTILPGVGHRFKIDMKKQAISTIHIQSPHSSVLVQYKLKNGKTGTIGAEVGRPSFTYVAGKLVQNAHEQVVDPAVFQSMNRRRLKPREIPKTITEYRKIEQGVTPDNFFKLDSSCTPEQLTEGNQPVDPAINLVDREDKKEQAVYLSDGTPVAIITQKVPHAGRLAKTLYFLTGQYPWEALRFGGYFAHDAATGQSRACEALVAFGSDLSGIQPVDLLPVLSELEPYDLSQNMRESLYENILFAELREPEEQDTKQSIFSEKAAKDYLTLSANAFVTMRIYKDLLMTAENKIRAAKIQGKTDKEAEAARDLVLENTKNFKRRYSHMWAIASYITISLHKTHGAEIFLDKADESVPVQKASKSKAPTSGVLTFLKQFILEKQQAVQPTLGRGSKRDQSVAANTFDLTSRSLDYLSKINDELGIKNS